MEILNDLTKCNFYYYILGSNKAYLIFKYLQLTNDFNCIGDALVRRQRIILNNKVIRFLNTNLKQQYQIIKELKSKPNMDLDQELFKYSRLGYLLIVQYLVNPPFNPADPRSALSNTIGIERSSLRDDLVSKGANIHARDDFVLRLAAGYGHLPIVQYLVCKGANIHARDDYALLWAAKNGHLQVVKYLVNPSESGTELINTNGIDQLYQSDDLLQSYVLNNFLNRKYEGADIHVRDDEALRWAAQKGHLQVVQYLVSIGANFNIHANIHPKDQALVLAAKNGHLQVVKYLISIGDNIRAKLLYALSSLPLSNKTDHLEVQQYLLYILNKFNNDLY